MAMNGELLTAPKRLAARREWQRIRPKPLAPEMPDHLRGLNPFLLWDWLFGNRLDSHIGAVTVPPRKRREAKPPYRVIRG